MGLLSICNKQKYFQMNRNTKIALIVAGVIALGVGIYYFVSKNKFDSKDKDKNNRKMSII